MGCGLCYLIQSYCRDFTGEIIVCVIVLQHLKTPEVSVLGNVTVSCVCFTMMYGRATLSYMLHPHLIGPCNRCRSCSLLSLSPALGGGQETAALSPANLLSSAAPDSRGGRWIGIMARVKIQPSHQPISQHGAATEESEPSSLIRLQLLVQIKF